MNLVIHPITMNHIVSIVTAPPHGLLLEGPRGIGKGALSRYLASQILNLDISKIDTHPYIKSVVPEASISIDDIRGLNHFVKLKIPGGQSIKRIIIVEHAQLMTTEAQNAFLKLLEEPPADTVIILTVENATQLLPTITSRVVALKVFRPVEVEVMEYFTKLGYDQIEINRAYQISGGLPGLMNSILDKEIQEPLLDYITKAKELLSATTYERLTKIDEIIKQKDDLNLLMVALLKTSKAALGRSIKTGKVAEAKKWHSVAVQLLSKEKALKQNPYTKLFLSDLMLSL